MKTRYTVVLSLIAGAAVGAAAIQGLHAQAKPKAYLVTESEVLDAAALAKYTADISAVQKAAGGRSFGTRGKIVATVGDAPKRVGLSEWDSLEKAEAFYKSKGFQDLASERDKAETVTRLYAVEALPN